MFLSNLDDITKALLRGRLRQQRKMTKPLQGLSQLVFLLNLKCSCTTGINMNMITTMPSPGSKAFYFMIDQSQCINYNV